MAPRRVARTPYDREISAAAGALDRYLNAVPTVLSSGDQDEADRAFGDMHAHLEKARQVKPGGTCSGTS